MQSYFTVSRWKNRKRKKKDEQEETAEHPRRDERERKKKNSQVESSAHLHLLLIRESTDPCHGKKKTTEAKGTNNK